MKQATKKWAFNIGLFSGTAVLALVIGSQLPALLKKVGPATRGSDYSMHVSQLPHKLTLYGTTTCPHCAKAREFLSQAGIPFNDLNIDQSKAAEKAYQRLGEKYVPILVSEKKLVVGFDQKAYAELGRIVYASATKETDEK